VGTLKNPSDHVCRTLFARGVTVEPMEEQAMQDQSVGGFLSRLADRVPAPGGGASAALHAAQAAALLAMVGRYSNGAKYAEHRAEIDEVVSESDRLRSRALQLAVDDEVAFSAVAAAYGLPKSTDEEKADRSTAIAEALVGAAQPPAETVQVAADLVDLAERILPVGNRNVLSDVAAAAEALRAAAVVGQVNVEVNLSGIRDQVARAELKSAASAADVIKERADRITTAVRKEIAE
jgi:methenyltetrahydrofolate cyclohydrolase